MINLLCLSVNCNFLPRLLFKTIVYFLCNYSSVTAMYLWQVRVMSLQYSRGLLRVVIAQLCRQLGWNAIHSSPLELLTNILERYILQLGSQAHRFSELCMCLHHLHCDDDSKIKSNLSLLHGIAARRLEYYCDSTGNTQGFVSSTLWWQNEVQVTLAQLS